MEDRKQRKVVKSERNDREKDEIRKKTEYISNKNTRKKGNRKSNKE